MLILLCPLNELQITMTAKKLPKTGFLNGGVAETSTQMGSSPTLQMYKAKARVRTSPELLYSFTDKDSIAPEEIYLDLK
jgi:hypothetical protein